MKLKIILISHILTFCLLNAQNITIDQNYTAQQLVENVLINSPCAQVSNAIISGGNFVSNDKSYAYFSNINPIFPLSNGILLSTGKAISAVGPNTYISDDTTTNWNGDTDLNQALNISNSLNTTYLEFDFIPLANSVTFDYIFSSEEYHGTAPCQYSDGFAFLIRKQSESVYQNIALIPNTTIPVKVTTVRPEITGSCNAQNQQYFGGFNATDHPTNFNGQTVILTAKAQVTPNESYHIKIVIADEGNYRYDSALFLSGGSFKSEIDLGNDRTLAQRNPLCGNETLLLDATQAQATSYKWYKNNILIAGATTAQYLVNSAGIYKVEATLTGNSCIINGEINIEYAEIPLAQNVVFSTCDTNNDGISTYNLDNIKPEIIASSQNYSITFFASLYDAQHNQNQLNSNFTNTIPNQIIFARVEKNGVCPAFAQIILQTSNTVLNVSHFIACKEGNVAHFDLSEKETEIYSQLPSGNFSIQFFVTESDALFGNNALTLQQTISTNSKTIYYKVLNDAVCYSVGKFDLIASENPNVPTTENVEICENETITLTATQGFSHYSWNDGSTGNTKSINALGTYFVDIYNENNCVNRTTFEVISRIIPQISGIVYHNQSIEIQTTFADDNLEYSINGISWQSSPIFENVINGEYVAQVRVSEYCISEAYAFRMFQLTNILTLNNDGMNEIWNFDTMKIPLDSQITLFDRYGKLIFEEKITTTSYNWNGKYLGRNLNSGTYWFILKIPNSKEISGWIVVKNVN